MPKLPNDPDAATPWQTDGKRQALALVFWIGLCFAAAAIGSLTTVSEIEGWYQTLNKPSFNPPNWIFGPVWTLLYLKMGIAAWLVWRASGWGGARWALALFLIQLVANALWSHLFFGWHLLGVAAFEIIALAVLILATLMAFRKHSPTAALMLVPYLAWVSFATVLNWSIWRLNP